MDLGRLAPLSGEELENLNRYGVAHPVAHPEETYQPPTEAQLWSLQKGMVGERKALPLGPPQYIEKGAKPPPPCFQGMRGDGCFWFRIFGYGITAKDSRKHTALFSQRHGLVRWYQIGHWQFKLLDRSWR